MGDRTSIEWTRDADGTPGASWNPVTGCSPVSPGCNHCYAAGIAHRFAGTPAYPDGFAVTLRPDRLEQPLRWLRPRRIFVNSMSDLTHRDVPDQYIARIFAVMALGAQHTYLILTKRPGRLRSLLSSKAFTDEVLVQTGLLAATRNLSCPPPQGLSWPLPNVWLGVSVESEKWKHRIQQLLQTPAAVRFASCEPLLGPLLLCSCDGAKFEVTRHPLLISANCPLHGTIRLDWVIVGGESGAGARPMHPAWARSLRDQCVVTSTPFFFKQWGEWSPAADGLPQRRMTELDVAGVQHDPATPIASRPRATTPMVRIGKKAAGRLLDGQQWDQAPVAPSSRPATTAGH